MLCLIGLAGVVWVLLRTDRSSQAVISLFSIAFAFYIFILRYRAAMSMVAIVSIAIGLRLSMLNAIPNLSDDYYRFAWDGRLVAMGESPYAHLPKDLGDYSPSIDPDGALLKGMNSRGYYSVYPPLNQLMFGLAAWLSRGDLQANVIWLRIIIWLGELLTLFFLVHLLRALGKDQNLWVVYALNPLVLVELTGNLHFEGWVAAFVLGAFYFFQKQKHGSAGLMLAGGALVKLIPLIFIPMLWARQTWRQRLVFCVAGVVAAMLFCLPFLSIDLLRKFASSVDLYFRSFEFNGSVYYLARQVGIWVKGYNPIAFIGPLLGAITFIAVLAFSFVNKFKVMPVALVALLILTVHLLMGTTVHPWYVVTLVALSPVANVRWPLVWSALVVLSYSHYTGGGFAENDVLIALEYFLLALWIAWEFLRPSSGFRIIKSG